MDVGTMSCSICDDHNGSPDICHSCITACRCCSHYVCMCRGRVSVGNAVRQGILHTLQNDDWLMQMLPPLRCIHWWRYSWDQGMRLYHLHHWLERWYQRSSRRGRAEAEAHLRNIASALTTNLRPTPRLMWYTILCLSQCDLPNEVICAICQAL